MKPLFKLALGCLLLSGISAGLRAQTTGDDPRVPWSTLKGTNYQMIYPQGDDSLAQVYARRLEAFRPRLGASLGYLPNQHYRRPMPVVLRNFNGVSNGFVTWVPHRMELYTNPAAEPFLALPWETALAVHEGRHVAQFQMGQAGLFKPFSKVFGDYVTQLAVGLLPDPALMEGDAVVAETALTDAGRGRSGDFLSYMRMSFDRRDWRNYYRWRYGSLTRYTPDYYRAGYMMVAGMRTAYGDTLFMKRYFKQFRTPLRLNNLRRTVRQGSGLKFAAAWQGIEESFRDRWAEEDALRGDPTPLRTVSPEPRYYTGYFGTVTDGANLYSFKSGLTNPGQLVRTAPDGTETPLRPLSSHASNLAFDRTGGRIFFSEPVPHPRWGLAMTSRIRYADAEGRISDLTDTGRYYNPVLSPDDRQIAFVEYPRQGGSILHIRSLDEDAAELLYTAPDGLQIVECVLTGQEAVFSGLSEEGFGLYAFSSRPGSPSPVRTVLAPQPVRVKNLKYTAQGILLTCDRTGIDDIYCLDPADGTLRQLTQSRYGADYAVFNDACDTLYYSALTPAGRLLHATAAKDLAWKPADFTQRAAYPVAALLSAQEAALAAENPVQAADGTLSDPVPYPKAAHLLKLHSWLPFYSDSGGVDYGYDKQGAVSAFPGVTFLFQNLLGNATGMISYAGTMKERLQWSPDLSAITTEKQFRNSFHARFTYSGFYPVIEVGADVNNRPAYAYGRLQTGTGEAATLSVVSPFLHKVYAQGNLRISVPLNFSQRGWDRELVPQVIWSLSNDSVTGNVWQRDANPETEAGSLPLPYTPPVPVATDDVHRLLHRFTLALRGSVTRSSAASPSFPRLGIGFEGGARAYTAASWAYSPRVFGRIYGYLPGLTSMQGMMLSASAVHCFRDFNLIGDDFDVFPRGYAENALGALADFYCGTRAGFTFDYSIPFLSLDRNISSLFYIRNLEAVPFADLTWLRFSQPPTARPSGSTLYSVGGDLLLNLGKVLMVRNSLKCGIRLAYNGGSAFETFRQWDPNLSHGYVHLVVRTDLTETSGLHR